MPIDKSRAASLYPVDLTDALCRLAQMSAGQSVPYRKITSHKDLLRVRRHACALRKGLDDFPNDPVGKKLQGLEFKVVSQRYMSVFGFEVWEVRFLRMPDFGAIFASAVKA